MITQKAPEETEKKRSTSNKFTAFLAEIGLDINPLHLALGGGGVLIILMGFCITGMIRKFLAKKKLEQIQQQKLAAGPSK